MQRSPLTKIHVPTQQPPPFLTAASFQTDKHPWLAHGFFGRKGGVSTGVFSSLNVSFAERGDQPDCITENRLRVANALNIERAPVIFAHQKHTTIALIVDKPFEGERPIADALVTNTPGLLIGVQTADCVPVLFIDETTRVIAAAHAGWKGLADGILQNTLIAMESLGANRTHIIAAIGPCIHADSYEIGDNVKAAYPQFPELFTPWTNKIIGTTVSKTTTHKETFAFDIPMAAYLTLKQAGIRNISSSPINTYTNPTDYFSYRRSTHNGDSTFGNQASVIGIKAHL
jgi:YfiH family protein